MVTQPLANERAPAVSGGPALPARLGPGAFDRVALVGMTGSGKTYLARGALSKLKRLIVCDAKGFIAGENWRLENWQGGYEKLLKGEDARVYVPPLNSDADWERIFWQIYRLRRVTVYIDELYQVGPSFGSEGLRALYTQGRQLEIGMYSSVQRPAFVPKFIFSEASYIFCFSLQLEDDLDTMGKQMGRRVREEPLGWYGFWVYDVRARQLYKYQRVQYVTHRVEVQDEGGE